MAATAHERPEDGVSGEYSRIGPEPFAWYVPIETCLFERFGWSLRDLDGLLVEDVYEYYRAAKFNQSQELLWQLNIADYPHLTGRDGQNVRKAILAQAKQVGETEARPSPFTQVDKRTRLRMIGAGLKSTHADRWRRHNASQFEWLSSEGLTVQDALDEYERWLKSMKELGAFQNEEAA